MLILREGPASRSELARKVGHKAITRALRQSLTDLMNAGFVGYTIPEKTNSRLQKYKALKPDKNQTNQPLSKKAGKNKYRSRKDR